jgi:hypothetical protein
MSYGSGRNLNFLLTDINVNILEDS